MDQAAGQKSPYQLAMEHYRLRGIADMRMDHEQTIQHLGGLRSLQVMVCAMNWVKMDTCLRFSFKGSRKYNTCEIELDTASDTYILRLGKPFEDWRSVTEFLYADQLRVAFEQATGLYLRL